MTQPKPSPIAQRSLLVSPADRTARYKLRLLVSEAGPQRLSGGALERLRKITPMGHAAVVHVSCAEAVEFAQSIVTISATPVR